LERSIKDLTNESKFCRAEYDMLLVSSERSHTLHQEKDLINKTNLQKILEENENMKHKIFDQKCSIKAHKQTEKGFHNDMKQFEISNRSLDLREKNNSEKYENIDILNNNLKDELAKQNDVSIKLNGDLLKQNTLIEKMVPKEEYDDCILKLNTFKKQIENDMVDLDIHQNLKCRYSESLKHMEKNMVNRNNYEDAILQLNSLVISIKDDHIPLNDYLISENKLKLLDDEKNSLLARISVFEKELESNNGELRESEAKCRSLRNRIEQTEAELMAAMLRGEAMEVNIKDLHHESALINAAKEEIFQKNISLETSQSVLLIQIGNLKSNLRKEIDIKMKNEKSFKITEETLLEVNKNLNQNLMKAEEKYQNEIHEIKRRNESDLITMSTENNEILNDINVINDDTKNNLILEYNNDVKRIDIENKKQMHLIQTDFDDQLETLHNKYKNEISVIKNDNNMTYNNNFIKNNEYIESMNMSHIEDITTIISKHEYDLNLFSTNLHLNHSQETSVIMESNNDLVKKMNDKYNEVIIQRESIEKCYREELETIQKEKISLEIHLLNIESKNYDDLEKIKKENFETLINIEKINLENLEKIRNDFDNNKKTLLLIERQYHEDVEKVKKENFENLLKIEKTNFENLEEIKIDFDKKSARIKIEKMNLERLMLEGQEKKIEMMVKYVIIKRNFYHLNNFLHIIFDFLSQL
jgi:hypothetical protein